MKIPFNLLEKKVLKDITLDATYLTFIFTDGSTQQIETYKVRRGFNLGNVGPVINFTYPHFAEEVPLSANATFAVRISITDADGVIASASYSLDDAAYVSIPLGTTPQPSLNLTLPLPNITAGSHKLTVKATDDKGQESIRYVRWNQSDSNEVWQPSSGAVTGGGNPPPTDTDSSAITVDSSTVTSITINKIDALLGTGYYAVGNARVNNQNYGIIFAMDTSNQLRWHKLFQIGTDFQLKDVVALNDGCIVSGTYYRSSPTDYYDMYAARFTTDGNLAWSNGYGNINNSQENAAICTDGVNSYLVGTCLAEPSATVSQYALCVYKVLNTNGNLLSSKITVESAFQSSVFSFRPVGAKLVSSKMYIAGFRFDGTDIRAAITHFDIANMSASRCSTIDWTFAGGLTSNFSSNISSLAVSPDGSRLALALNKFDAFNPSAATKEHVLLVLNTAPLTAAPIIDATALSASVVSAKKLNDKYATQLAVDNDAIYIADMFGTSSFLPYVAELNFAGNLQWEKQYDCSTLGSGQVTALCPFGNQLVIGSYITRPGNKTVGAFLMPSSTDGVTDSTIMNDISVTTSLSITQVTPSFITGGNWANASEGIASAGPHTAHAMTVTLSNELGNVFS